MTETRTRSVHFEWGEVESVTLEVVGAIADITGVDPSEIEPVATEVDPDSIDALFAPRDNGDRRNRGHVRFPVDGHDVTVYAHGEIVVHE